MKKFVVAEETDDMCGLELVEDEEEPERFVILKDVGDSDFSLRNYFIHREDIPKLIEGLKLFVEE